MTRGERLEVLGRTRVLQSYWAEVERWKKSLHTGDCQLHHDHDAVQRHQVLDAYGYVHAGLTATGTTPL